MSERSDHPPAEIRRLTVEDLSLWRQIRLEALRDSPEAFGSTYEDESTLGLAGWQTKWENWTCSPGGGVWVALIDREAAGLVGGVCDREVAGRVWLISMWVSPKARRRGIGRALVESVIAWAKTQGLNEIRLQVTSNNPAAQKLYELIGFKLTDGSEAHARKPSKCEHEMRLVL